MEWSCTRTVLIDLENLLTCGLCKNMLSDPCTLGNCDHNFCRKCIEKKLGSDSNCPDCGAFSWVKDLKSNHQLSLTVSMVTKLSSIIGPSKDQEECHSEDGSFPEKMIATINSPNLTARSVKNPPAVEPTACNDETGVRPLPDNGIEIQYSVRDNKVQRVQEVTPLKEVMSRKCKNSQPSIVKRYALRGKLKRHLSPSVANSTSNIENELNVIKERSHDTSSCYEPGSGGKRSKHSKHDEISIESKTSKTKKAAKSRFTSIQPRSHSLNTSCNDEQGNQKKNNKYPVIAMQNVNKSSTNSNTASTIVHDNENVTLNVKRKNVKRRNGGIRRYLVEANMDSLPQASDSTESQSYTQPNTQELKKPRVNANISSSQESRNKKGETPLHLAAIKGDVCTALELIEEGANPNAKDHAGWTPLHEACNHGNVDVVELLLDHGALVNIPGFDNDSPLHDAVANNRLDVVKLLVKRGASLQTRNKQGLIPMDYAATRAMKNALQPRDPTARGAGKCLKADGILKIVNSQVAAVVVLGTALNRREREILENCVPRLGGTIVNEFNESVTHVVTSVNDEGLCPRTIKYSSGVLTGKWIVRFQWVCDSVKQKEWISEEDYEVRGTAGNVSNGPMKSRINMTQQLPPLFEGCSFFLRGNFIAPTPNKQYLANLIKLGGGTILHREPKMKDDDVTSLPGDTIVTSFTRQPQVAYHARVNSSLSCCTQFIIYDTTHDVNQKIIYSPILCTAPVMWLMDCISSFELLDIPNRNVSTQK